MRDEGKYVVSGVFENLTILMQILSLILLWPFSIGCILIRFSQVILEDEHSVTLASHWMHIAPYAYIPYM